MAITTYSVYIKRLKGIYEQYGYAVSDAVLNEFIRAEGLSANFCITLRDVRSDLEHIHRQVMQLGKRAVLTDEGSMPILVLDTYPKYMKALERWYTDNGYTLPDDLQIATFITSNGLDRNFRITVADVKKDLQTIERKFRGLEPCKVPPKTAAPTTKKNKITTCDQYSDALKKFLTQHGDNAFLDVYIKRFLSDHILPAESANLISDIRMDLVMLQNGLPLNSATAKRLRAQPEKLTTLSAIPSSFKCRVEEMVLKHQELIEQRNCIRSLLMDYFPREKREVRILALLVEEGILDEIQICQTLEVSFVGRYVTRMVDQYGINKDLATEMVQVWCYAYGQGLLGKKVIL